MAVKQEFIIEYSDLLREIENEKSEFLFLDVRDPKLIEHCKLPRFINVTGTIDAFISCDKKNFEKQYGISKPDLKKKIILVSCSFKRAETALKTLNKNKYEQVYIYAGGTDEWRAKQNNNRQKFIITYDQLLEVQNNPDVLIIDVREPEEFDKIDKITLTIPNSINIRSSDVVKEFELSEENFQTKYSKPKPTEDTKIIFSCRSGNRSECVQKQMQELGYEQVFNFEGGWKEWKRREEEKKKENDSETQKQN
ncbi:PREDICTED: thiosulfate sulfurtransferase/rhodanese-like domain-containing protein 3 [Trachymyrmex septentrionalis]|uniref:thiosulfate sulfurtransferase/rhodanese-like domain-containing protein 3 n=1 Tax=Trachymyrmex septentrionalis TaxID=34720 RepID=UPI00084ED557|nr:PREDICTED: thiosulfate sulfurtransferase/rhodanese-like domain-containing protein 3 [Trachymyrmex septentrionalis]